LSAERRIATAGRFTWVSPALEAGRARDADSCSLRSNDTRGHFVLSVTSGVWNVIAAASCSPRSRDSEDGGSWPRSAYVRPGVAVQ